MENRDPEKFKAQLKRTRKKIPTFIYDTVKELADKYPTLTPQSLYEIFKTATTKVKEYLIKYPDRQVEFHGFGKFRLLYKRSSSDIEGNRIRQDSPNSEDRIMQYYLRFSASKSAVLAIREQLGTLTKTQEKAIERNREYLEILKEKRAKFLTERARLNKLKRGEQKHPEYKSQFADLLKLNL